MCHPPLKLVSGTWEGVVDSCSRVTCRQINPSIHSRPDPQGPTVNAPVKLLSSSPLTARIGS